jgi:pimeloyl-ACP methyl ester carboxylesterase
MTVEIPETRYAKTEDGVHIAYQVLGDGPVDVVYVPGFASHLEYAWGLPALARYYRRLSTFSRLILIDRAGTGLSDRLPEREVPTLESRMDDVRAVLDGVDSARAAFIGEFGTGAMCTLFAATYPDRSVALVLLSTFVRGAQAPDYPWAWDRDEWRDAHRWVERAWGTEEFVRQHAVRWAPSLAEDAAFARWYAGLLRIAASPATALAIERVEEETDVRDVLHTIAVPTLVCGCTSNPDFPLNEQRFITSRIPGANLVELQGANALLWAGDQDALLGEIEVFLREVRAEEVEFDRVLATVLFTDIVGSTEKAAELGDRGWRDLVERHHSAVRANLVRYRGREVDTAGDGFFATFRRACPSRALCPGHCGSGEDPRARDTSWPAHRRGRDDRQQGRRDRREHRSPSGRARPSF